MIPNITRLLFKNLIIFNHAINRLGVRAIPLSGTAEYRLRIGACNQPRGVCRADQHGGAADRIQPGGEGGKHFWLPKLKQCRNGAADEHHVPYQPPTKARGWLAFITLLTWYRPVSSAFTTETSSSGLNRTYGTTPQRERYVEAGERLGTRSTAVYPINAGLPDDRLIPEINASATTWSSRPNIPGREDAANSGPYQEHDSNVLTGRLASFFKLRLDEAENPTGWEKRKLVRLVLRSIQDRPEGAANLAKDIHSGGASGLPVIHDGQRSQHIIHQWISRQIYREGIVNYIIKQTMVHREDTAPILYSLQRTLGNKIDKILGAGNQKKQSKYKQYVLKNIVLPEFPWLNATLTPNVEEDNERWILSYAGLSFAGKLGVDIATIMDDEAYALGMMLYLQLTEGLLPPEWITLFTLPSVIAYIRSNPDGLTQWPPSGRQRLKKTALQHFFAQLDHMEKDNERISSFNASLSRFKPRSQLTGGEQSYNTHERDLAFNQQNEQIANTFLQVDYPLILKSFSSMDPENKNFIEGAEVALGEFSLIKIHNTAREPLFFPALPYDKDRLTILNNPRNTDIFRVSRTSDSRIYALVGVDGKYNITRVDRTVALYGKLLAIDDQRALDDGFSLEYSFSDAIEKNSTDTTVAAAASQLALKHKRALRKQLDVLGYDTTGTEKARDILLAMVPFYSCMESVRGGAGGEAIFNCGLDVVSLIPILGTTSKLSIHLGRGLAKGTIFTGQRAFMRLAMGNGGRQALKQALFLAGSDYIYYGVRPLSGTMTKKNLITLGLAAARGVDPGVELLFRLGNISIKQILRLGRQMKTAIPGLNGALRKIRRARLLQVTRIAKFPPKVGRIAFGPLGPPGAVMKMDAGQAGASAAFGNINTLNPTTLSMVLPRFRMFLPIYNFELVSAININAQMKQVLRIALCAQPYVSVVGLSPVSGLERYPYLARAQDLIGQQINSVFRLVENAKYFLLSASGHHEKRDAVLNYFTNALAVENREIAHMAFIAMEQVLQKMIRYKKNIQKRIVLVSSVRKKNHDNLYPTPLTDGQLFDGDVGFCIPGDAKKRIFLVVDRLLDYHNPHVESTHVILHEITHSIASTDDTFYMGSVGLRTGGTQALIDTFNQKLAQRTLNLVHIRYKLSQYLNMPPGVYIDDASVYRALQDDAVFRANIMMFNADCMVRYIEDLAQMNLARSARSADFNNEMDRKIEQAIMILLLKFIL